MNEIENIRAEKYIDQTEHDILLDEDLTEHIVYYNALREDERARHIETM